MIATGDAAMRARWEVIWMHPRKSELVRKPFGHDLQGAIDLYTKLKTAKRRAVTLRCMNMGFPPPDEYADREEVIVTRNGKRYKGKKIMEPRQYQRRMRMVNLRGLWWCPYCRQLRRFVKSKGFKSQGIYVADERMVCPVCQISDRDFHVRRYNPAALMLEMRGGRISDPNRASRRQRERRRRREQA